MPHYYKTFSDLKKLVRVHGEAVVHLLREERRLRLELESLWPRVKESHRLRKSAVPPSFVDALARHNQQLREEYAKLTAPRNHYLIERRKYESALAAELEKLHPTWLCERASVRSRLSAELRDKMAYREYEAAQKVFWSRWKALYAEFRVAREELLEHLDRVSDVKKRILEVESELSGVRRQIEIRYKDFTEVMEGFRRGVPHNTPEVTVPVVTPVEQGLTVVAPIELGTDHPRARRGGNLPER